MSESGKTFKQRIDKLMVNLSEVQREAISLRFKDNRSKADSGWDEVLDRLAQARAILSVINSNWFYGNMPK